MPDTPEPKGVFINCPYDEDYKPFFEATIFAVIRCGFKARAAAERVGGAETRIAIIRRIIEECPLGIHDLSRTQLHPEHGLPRFNMPFELGLFLGARFYGDDIQSEKDCLVLDEDLERYRKFISDISGQDISEHGNSRRQLVDQVRTFLNSYSGDIPLPAGSVIWAEYEIFRLELPDICAELQLDPSNLDFEDFAYIVYDYVSDESAAA